MTREEIIDLIDNRIKSEYKKHGDLDWSMIAAHKIYSSLEGALDVGKEREDSVAVTDSFISKFQEIIYGDLSDSEIVNALHKLDNDR